MSADFMVKAKKGYGKSFKIFEGSSILCQYGKSLPLKPDVLPDYQYYFIIVYNSLHKFKDSTVEHDEEKM